MDNFGEKTPETVGIDARQRKEYSSVVHAVYREPEGVSSDGRADGKKEDCADRAGVSV